MIWPLMFLLITLTTWEQPRCCSSSERPASPDKIGSECWLPVHGRIQIEGSGSFEFSRLGVFVLFRRAGDATPEVLGRIVPRSDGRFTFAVPAQSLVSLELTSSDPTLQLPHDVSFPFYVLSESKRVILMEDELHVVDASPEELTFAFVRSAAFEVCLGAAKTGAVQFRRIPTDGQNEGFVSFRGSGGRQLVGGLSPGRWLVQIVDEEDVELFGSEVVLHPGQVQALNCTGE